MIFKKPQKSKNISHPTPPCNWKCKFKMELYIDNYLALRKHEERREPNNSKNDQAGTNLVRRLRRSDVILRYKTNAAEGQVPMFYPFSVYIPLKKSVQFDDELTNTLVYLRTLKDTNRHIDQDSLYTSIRKALSTAKHTQRLRQGWQTCLRRYVIGLDVLQRMELFMEILKYGSGVVEELHCRWSGGAYISVFMERVMAVSRYWQHDVRINKTWKISV
jgi:hypothetical protein